MISRALFILVIISQFPVLQLPPKVMAQTPPSEGAKVLVDDRMDNRHQIIINIAAILL
jgi:hypothetical protein